MSPTTNRLPRPTTRTFVHAFSAHFLCLLLLLASATSAQQQSSTLVPSTIRPRPYCMFDQIRKAEKNVSRKWQSTADSIDALLRHQPKHRLHQVHTAKSASTANFVIPVVFYIVHNGGPENISDQQVSSQLDVMNAEFAGHGVEFCLASTDGSTPLPGTPNPGIIRIQSPLTDHLQAQEQQLKALSPLNGDRFLRVWVVKDINNGSGIAGYARFPGGNPALDGIVAKYTSFGESSTCSCTLLPNYDKGYVMIHEVGHWLGLYHTFQGGCAGTTAADCALAGDQVCDTPPVAAPNYGCPGAWSVNSCQGTPHDLLDNFMDYTNDACKSAFTSDQETRMLNAISNFRQTLVSAQNHQHTGINCVPTIVFSEFTATNFNPCLGESVTFTATSVTGATYDWDFGDLTTGTGASVTHAYNIAAPQQFDVTLTVTVNGQSVSSSKKVFFTPCTVTNCSQGNWYFGNFAALDFSSGSPQATFGSGLATIEGTVTESLPNCGLVFYSNGIYVWDHQHSRINPTQPLTGHVSTAQSALSIPDPGGSDDYFLFTLPVNFNTTDPWAFSRVVVTLNGSGTAVNNVALTNINTPIALPAGINGLSEAQTAIEKCNNEYWILVKENAPNGAMLVYSFTSTGIAHVATVPASGHGTGSTTMSFSRDGATLMVSELGGSWISLFDFDRSTGTLSNERHIVTSQQVYGASFSPDSRYVYLSEGVAQPEIVQYDRQSANFQSSRRYVGDAVHYINNIRIGPDDKLYLSNYGIRYLSVINYPNERVNSLAPNACGYNPDGPSVENPSPGSTNPFVQGGLPWYISAQPAALVPLEITHAMVNCSTVVFQAPDCNGPYSWDFGDPASGSSNTASVATATHTFSSDGNYVVTLQAGSNTRTANITIGLDAPLAGSSEVCPALSSLGSYACTLIPGAQYTWSVSSGGSLQQPNGNASMDVLWTTLPGTVTVQVTDPLTTCTTTETMTVTQNCSTADLYMKDHPIDPGTEPGLSSGPMWTSQDIWIRNSQDPPPFAQQHAHENPVYAAGTPNYVYVKVRNRGQAASAGTEQLKLYWAKASTGLSWPTPWNGGSYFGVPPNMPKGDLIATQTIPVVAPNADVILEFPWYPEDPDSYASIFGLDKSHYCLLARIETDPLPPYGMSNAETASLHHNVQYNNNIVWKNITFVDASSGSSGSGSVLIGPVLDPTRATVLQLGLRQDEGDDFMAHGIAQLTVDGDFAKRLRAEEVQLKGLEWKDERTLLITAPEATLANVRLRPKEQPVLLFDFSWKPESRVKSGRDYQFTVVQLEQDEKGARHVVGGETFLVRKPRDEEAPKKRFWLWRWLFRLFGK